MVGLIPRCFAFWAIGCGRCSGSFCCLHPNWLANLDLKDLLTVAHVATCGLLPAQVSLKAHLQVVKRMCKNRLLCACCAFGPLFNLLPTEPNTPEFRNIPQIILGIPISLKVYSLMKEIGLPGLWLWRVPQSTQRLSLRFMGFPTTPLYATRLPHNSLALNSPK